MKVAINCCFGGFCLSELAFETLLERKGIKFDFEHSGSNLLGNNYYVHGHLGEEGYYLDQTDFCQDRADPDLIAVIEQLGKHADSWSSELAIVEIPDDVKWHISEYDGIEHVAENHRTWNA